MTLARLLVHDTPLPDRPTIESILLSAGLGVDVCSTTRLAEFQAALLQVRPDLILCAYRTADLAASDAIRHARQRYTDVPFVVFSDIPGEELAVECMKFGATDYLLRDKHDLLLSTVRITLDRQRQQRNVRPIAALA